MSTPTYLPEISLTRTLPVVRFDRTTSLIERSRGLVTFLLCCAILAGASLFTFVPTPQKNRLAGTHDHDQSLGEEQNGIESPYSSLSIDATRSFRLDQVAAVNWTELFSAAGIPSIQPAPQASVGLNAMTQNCAGRCWDPHPGAFRYWEGERNGCWIQIWRMFQDQCRHYQWYNSCNGTWDSYPNGAPRVFWNCCVH